MDTGARVLTAEALEVARDGRSLLRAVDLHLDRGEVLAVLGPNGVGKSSLLSVLAGLLPASAGTVTTHGRVAASLQAPALARRSVAKNIEAALAWWGVARGERAERAAAALDWVNASSLAGRLATTLSGGEARRVHLARALALEADALLLDEPFAGLDPPTRAGLLRDVSAALRDRDRGTLLVVHERAEAWALADRLIVLLDGRVAASGSPAQVLERPPSVDVAQFLGFNGWLRERGGARRLVRPAHVTLDPEGHFAGVVRARTPEEDTVLVDIELEDGRVQARASYPGPSEGDTIRFAVSGGTRFEDEAG